jgi:subtilase family serine protease
MVIVAPAASAASATPSTKTTTGFAVGERLCQPQKQQPGVRDAECFAMRRVLVKKGTPGARPFKLAAGATANAAPGPAQTIGPAGGLTPSDLSTAYGFNSTATGSGQTVAIVDAFDDPTIESDLGTFDSNYGLPACTTGNGCLTKVNQTGASSPLPTTNAGWAGEIALDVETVHSVCQSCKILLLEADDNSFANFDVAENEAANLKATEITNSFGAAGVPSTTDETAFNHPGVVITASTGDDGYYSFDQFGAANAPAFPAAAGTVVAVGGTSLYLGQNATRQSETVWNDNGTRDAFQFTLQQLTGKVSALGATGGGCSTSIPAPAWQTHVTGWSQTACGPNRLPADVSSDADYLTGFDTFDTTGGKGWTTIGGTSLASPTIAAMFALAGGAHGINYPALTLYGHLGTPSLHDVTVGGNGWCGGEGAAACGNPNGTTAGTVDCDFPPTGSTPSVGDRACDALGGYDGPTGVGTPNGLGAFAKTGPTAKVTGPTSVIHGTSNTWTASTTDPFPGGHPSTYTWGWGDGTPPTVVTTAATTASAPHKYTTGGVSRTITLTVKNNYGQTVTKTFSVKVT